MCRPPCKRVEGWVGGEEDMAATQPGKMFNLLINEQ